MIIFRLSKVFKSVLDLSTYCSIIYVIGKSGYLRPTIVNTLLLPSERWNTVLGSRSRLIYKEKQSIERLRIDNLIDSIKPI